MLLNKETELKKNMINNTMDTYLWAWISLNNWKKFDIQESIYNL